MSWDAFWFKFAEVEERLALRRTLVLFLTVWMTWRVTAWGFDFGMAALKLDAAGVAGAGILLGAITAPIAFLQKAVFELYIKAKGGDAA